jgi:hypothetical protein
MTKPPYIEIISILISSRIDKWKKLNETLKQTNHFITTSEDRKYNTVIQQQQINLLLK